jgi:hypothetical protein
MWCDQDVSAEGAELSSEAAFGVDLEIEESGGDGSTCAESEKHDEEPATIGAEEAAEDAPEHGSIGCAVGSHHSPRRMGAG